jgi:uncharacterized radical SAM superfamily protein
MICFVLFRNNQDPSDDDIRDFISDEDVTKKIYSRYLSAVNIVELKRVNSYIKLVDLALEVFKIIYKETNKDIISNGIKELDVKTINIIVPTRSGKKILEKLKF